MTTVTSDLIWVKSFLATMRVLVPYPMQLFCDNQAALHAMKNPMFHERTKHIEMNCHFVREQLLSVELVTQYISLKNQVVDIFTKALSKHQFIYL